MKNAEYMVSEATKTSTESERLLGVPRRRHGPIAVSAIAAGAALLGGMTTVVADQFSSRHGVPQLIPYRGHLQMGSVPVNGPVVLEFALYDAPTLGTQIWGPETISVTAAAGTFSAMLGQTDPLDPAMLSGGDAYLEVSIGGSVLGRTRFGSAPYSLRSANGVPSGMIAFFPGTSCPPDWSEYSPGRGRYFVGLPSSGNAEATVGTALAGQENRTQQISHRPSSGGVLGATLRISANATPVDGANGRFINRVETGLQAVSYIHTHNLPNSQLASAEVAPFVQLLACQRL